MPIGGNFVFTWNVFKASMSILYKTINCEHFYSSKSPLDFTAHALSRVLVGDFSLCLLQWGPLLRFVEGTSRMAVPPKLVTEIYFKVDWSQ